MWLFTEEAATGITRTVISYVWVWLLSLLASWPWLMEQSWGDAVLGWVNNLDTTTLVLVGGSALYTAIRALAEKFPWVGYLLIFNKKPSYAGVAETPPVPPAV